MCRTTQGGSHKMFNPPRSGLLGDPKMIGGSTGAAVSGRKNRCHVQYFILQSWFLTWHNFNILYNNFYKSYRQILPLPTISPVWCLKGLRPLKEDI